jgi:hypothetical protein
MVLAAPGPLLTPPPSSSPPKTPHRSYSAQTRSQNEEKNPPPKPYLPLQTRTRHRRSHRPHVPMLMRGNTPPTTRSPPHRSRPTGNPPNRQPATVSEEERGGRDPTSRRTSMRAAPNCRPPPTARHASQPRSSTCAAPATLPSNKKQSTGSCAPARGRGPVPVKTPLLDLFGPSGPWLLTSQILEGGRGFQVMLWRDELVTCDVTWLGWQEGGKTLGGGSVSDLPK